MKKIAILMSVMMLLVLTTGAAMAAEKKVAKVVTMTGDVVKVDATAGTITIKAENKEHSFTAEPKLLEGITVGEKVTFEKSGTMLKSIQKVPTPTK
jgi:hypothetical protein